MFSNIEYQEEFKKLPLRYQENPNGPWFKIYSEQEISDAWGRMYDYLLEKKIDIHPIDRTFNFNCECGKPFCTVGIFFNNMYSIVGKTSGKQRKAMVIYALFFITGHILWMFEKYISIDVLKFFQTMERKVKEFKRQGYDFSRLIGFEPVHSSFMQCECDDYDSDRDEEPTQENNQVQDEEPVQVQENVDDNEEPEPVQENNQVQEDNEECDAECECEDCQENWTEECNCDDCRARRGGTDYKS